MKEVFMSECMQHILLPISMFLLFSHCMAVLFAVLKFDCEYMYLYNVTQEMI